MPAALACRLVGKDGTDVRAGIVVTGTELLSGLVTDRNGPWVAQRLGELGVEVAHLLCVGDRPADLAVALRFLADQGFLVQVGESGSYRTTPKYQIQVRELAAQRTFSELVELGVAPAASMTSSLEVTRSDLLS